MNNSQFRQLISGSPNQQNAASSPRPGASASGSLGTKKSSFVPMTPRTVRGGSDVDFARQVRERNAGMQPTNTKKFKSYAPKGVELGEGYTDRAKARATGEGNENAEDKAERVKALEEQMKLGQISPEMFVALRDKITGGDAASSHLVKGLDRQLLERVRRGEDVMGTGSGTQGAQDQSPEVDVDDELERLGEKEVEATKKEKTAKKGNMAPPPAVAGKKRSRNEIMAELKAQRQAAAEARNAAEPQLGDRWQKVSNKKQPKIEIDSKGREVMITVDENGKVKKRVRKAQIAQTDEAAAAMGAPDASKAVLGADVSIPELAKPDENNDEPLDDEDDDDIFEGVGTDYNPLGNMADDDSDDDSDDSDAERPRKKPTSAEPPAVSNEERSGEGSSPEKEANDTMPNKLPPARRNYFNDTPSASEETKHDHMAGIQEVLKKAAKMDPLANENEEEDREAREAKEAQRKRHAQMLANQDRDLDDMDMGFGGSRNDDEGDDEEGMKVKLAEWKGRAGEDGWDDEDGAGGGKAGGEKRKRKPKKRKGDASSMGDIMRVIEGRKGGEKK